MLIVSNIARFHLYKENRDTQEALGVIGKMLGVQVGAMLWLIKVHLHVFCFELLNSFVAFC